MPPVDRRLRSADLRLIIFFTALTPLPIEELRLRRDFVLEELSVPAHPSADPVRLDRRRESHKCDCLGRGQEAALGNWEVPDQSGAKWVLRCRKGPFGAYDLCSRPSTIYLTYSTRLNVDRRAPAPRRAPAIATPLLALSALPIAHALPAPPPLSTTS